jgi:hypothetical protein
MSFSLGRRCVGLLLGAVLAAAAVAAPRVAVIEDAPWSPADFSREGAAELKVLLHLAELMRADEPIGLVGIGDERGCFLAGTQRALEFAAARGVPVVRLGGGAARRARAEDDLFISGGDLPAAEACVLLASCLARFGPLPAADRPAARQRQLSRYQAEFDARRTAHVAVR